MQQMACSKMAVLAVLVVTACLVHGAQLRSDEAHTSLASHVQQTLLGQVQSGKSDNAEWAAEVDRAVLGTQIKAGGVAQAVQSDAAHNALQIDVAHGARASLAQAVHANAIFCAAFVANYGQGRWKEDVANWPDPNAQWISTPTPSFGNRSYFTAVYSASTAVRATIYYTGDNSPELTVNGKKSYGSPRDWKTLATSQVILVPGLNYIQFKVEDDGGSAAGLLASMQINGAFGQLFTDTTWQVTRDPLRGSATDTSACLPKASCAVSKGAYGAGTWGEGVTGWPDRTAHWMWGASRAPTLYFFTVFGASVAATATFFYTGDDSAELTVNGKLVGSISDWRKFATSQVQLIAGDNNIVFKVNNPIGGSGAGLLASMQINGEVGRLFTDTTWQYSTAPMHRSIQPYFPACGLSGPGQRQWR
jgi:hypothetical protein